MIQGPDYGNDAYLGPAIEDEAENELQMVLHKARKLKQKKERKNMAPSVEEKVTLIHTLFNGSVFWKQDW